MPPGQRNDKLSLRCDEEDAFVDSEVVDQSEDFPNKLPLMDFLCKGRCMSSCLPQNIMDLSIRIPTYKVRVIKI